MSEDNRWGWCTARSPGMSLQRDVGRLCRRVFGLARNLLRNLRNTG